MAAGVTKGEEMSEGQLTDLVRDLCDRGAITDLVSRLGRWLDEKQFDDAQVLASLFTPDIVLETPGGRSAGLAAAVEQARRRHTEERTQHVHTNVLIDLNGDMATVEANLIVTFVPRAAAPDIISQVGTRYSFNVIRTREGWRFSSIRDRLIWRRSEQRAM
jgi:hypothetical protein